PRQSATSPAASGALVTGHERVGAISFSSALVSRPLSSVQSRPGGPVNDPAAIPQSRRRLSASCHRHQVAASPAPPPAPLRQAPWKAETSEQKHGEGLSW